jgi:cell surface protein SprA
VPPIVSTEYIVKEYEVYKAINVIGQSAIMANAYIDLPPRSSSDIYSDSLRWIPSDPIPGKQEFGRFTLLNEGGDYLFHRETGYITFLSPVHDYDVIAIAYSHENHSPSATDDIIYGEFFADLTDSVGVLKLVKPKYVNSQMESAWNLKMKNRYQISPEIVYMTDLDLDIYLKKSDGSESNTINNVRLLELFGFDKFTQNGNVGPDGKFDNRIGYNFEPRTSEIIFPVIEPYGNNIPSTLNEYKYQEIYDTTKVHLSLPANSFIIKGKYKPI